MSNFNLEHALEALIFASPEPISFKQIAEIFESQGYETKQDELKEALEILRERQTGVAIQEVAGGYAFRTNPDYGQLVRALLQAKPQKLSNSQLEILSIVSYRQPVTRQEIEDIRGVDCSSALRRLLTVRLIKIMGKSQGIGRPLLYGTTREFLEFFGFNSLHELPTLKEYEELNQDKKEEDDEQPVAAEEMILKDLFEEREIISEDHEAKSQEALKELEKALGNVQEVDKSIQEEADA